MASLFDSLLPDRLKLGNQGEWYHVKYAQRKEFNGFFRSWQRAYEYVWDNAPNGVYLINDIVFSAGGAEFAKIVKVNLTWSEIE